MCLRQLANLDVSLRNEQQRSSQLTQQLTAEQLRGNQLTQQLSAEQQRCNQLTQQLTAEQLRCNQLTAEQQRSQRVQAEPRQLPVRSLVSSETSLLVFLSFFATF